MSETTTLHPALAVSVQASQEVRQRRVTAALINAHQALAYAVCVGADVLPTEERDLLATAGIEAGRLAAYLTEGNTEDGTADQDR